MELLCIKTSDDMYLRVCNGNCELTSVSKASVYPVMEAETVKKLLHEFIDKYAGMRIVKLTITESEFDIC